jgi:pimeloyl-ACP methyl ester carboxylesterase
MKTIASALIFCFSIVMTAQNLKIDSVQVVSRANDTIKALKGSFYVKENRTTIESDSIELAFVRLKSTNPNPGSPIVYLSGGPGGSGSNTLGGSRFELFMKLRQVADVIAFDQRGTGLSNRLKACPYRAKFDLVRAIDKSEYVKKSNTNTRKCLQFWNDEGVDLSAYNTTESAKDLEALRQVLQADKISLWGISYGSHLAFEYIRLYEDRVDKVVLASLEGPDETIKLPKNTEDFLFKIAELAKTNYGSDTTYPDLKNKIIKVHDRLQNQPAKGSFVNRDGDTVEVTFSNFELQSAISTFFLKNPEDSRSLPKVYDDMFKGDFSSIAADVWVVKKYLHNGVRPMSFAMDMQSGISPERAKLVKAQINQSILGSNINFLLFEKMQSLDFPMLPEAFRNLPKNNANALLLSGTLDGRTYLTSAKRIAEQFNNGQHVIIEHAGHDLYMSSPLIGDMVFRFFQGKNINLNRLTLTPILFE